MSTWHTLMDALNTTVLGTFAREVFYLPSHGEPVTLRAVVEAAKEGEDTTPGVYAVLFLRRDDLPGPPERGDEVTIDGTSYKVFDIEADGGGGVLLRLRQI